MIGKIRTFFSLPGRDKRVFLKTAALVPVLEIGIKSLGFKRTFTILKFFLNKDTLQPVNESVLVHLHANYLYLYHNRFPWLGNCLARSMTLWFLLGRKGIETDLKFGMKKENKKLLAHSWVEYEGTALITQSESDEGFIPFTESIQVKFSR